jgi:hypothetical protein
VDHSRYLADHIPGARLVTVPGADVTIYTKPTAPTLDHIEQFRTGTPPDPGTDRVLASILFTDMVGFYRAGVESGRPALARPVGIP